MSTLFAVFTFYFKSTFRNLKSTGIMFILPIVFMGVFGLAFGGENQVEFSVGFVENSPSDAVASVDVPQIFSDIDAKSNGFSAQVSTFDSADELRVAIENRTLDLGVVYRQPTPQSPLQSEVFVYQLGVSENMYRTVVSDILYSVSLQGESLVSTTQLREDTDSFSGFDALAPGLMVYGLIILIPGIAFNFAEIAEKRYLLRYAFSRISTFELLSGALLFYFFLGVCQLLLLYATARMFGYNASGNVLLALVPGLLSLLFVLAVGLCLGALFKKTEPASNVGTILSIILGFFSGAFISGIGSIFEFQIFGVQLQFNDIIPTKWGTDAVQAILTYNQTLSDIITELAVLSISGVIFLILAMVLYNRIQLRGRLS